MLNERVPTFQSDHSFKIEKDSLISGRKMMKTYLVANSTKEVEKFLQDNKIYYLFKELEGQSQMLFELFDEKIELIA